MTVTRANILLVEDDKGLRRSLGQWLALNSFNVTEAADGRTALALLDRARPDLVLSDVRMPGMDGLELLRAIKTRSADLPVLLLSGHGDVAMAVAAMQAGAFNFLTKPYVPEQLIATLNSAVEYSSLQRRLDELDRKSDAIAMLESRLIGTDEGMASLRRTINDIASYPLDVLIKGETGTGKEVVARLIHECSERKSGAFVAINCAALPQDICESELFGHDPGAFTGATALRVGKFEFARGGTVFLDEIESMTLATQAKLLRVLQERVVVRLGSNKEIPIDIRILSATKYDLAELSRQGRFRDDLYYRLMGAEVAIPPLRMRGSDPLVLFDVFSKKMCEKMGRSHRKMTADDMKAITRYAWPGNVRELKLLAERSALRLPWVPAGSETSCAAQGCAGTLNEQVAAYEWTLIEAMLERCDGNVRLAAEHLGVPHRTLNEKISRLGVSRRRLEEPAE